jgi:hypothetical protein
VIDVLFADEIEQTLLISFHAKDFPPECDSMKTKKFEHFVVPYKKKVWKDYNTSFHTLAPPGLTY